MSERGFLPDAAADTHAGEALASSSCRRAVVVLGLPQQLAAVRVARAAASRTPPPPASGSLWQSRRGPRLKFPNGVEERHRRLHLHVSSLFQCGICKDDRNLWWYFTILVPFQTAELFFAHLLFRQFFFFHWWHIHATEIAEEDAMIIVKSGTTETIKLSTYYNSQDSRGTMWLAKHRIARWWQVPRV